jgi:hypothetical protein
LSTVTVGRKFLRKHLQRALCCRLQELPCKAPFELHHPCILCTGVKVNEGEITETTKADFSNTICLAWNAVEQVPLRIDGESGWLAGSQDQTSANICARDLFELFQSVFAPLDDLGSFSLAKEARKGQAYKLTKELALEILTNRQVPAFARARKRRRQIDHADQDPK